MPQLCPRKACTPLTLTVQVIWLKPTPTSRALQQMAQQRLHVRRIESGSIQNAKTVGDGYYEQKLVNQQINQLTGRAYLNGYSNYEDQYKALMNNGLTVATDLKLTPGVALTQGQLARLTSDIVWLVSQAVTLRWEHPNCLGATSVCACARETLMAAGH